MAATSSTINIRPAANSFGARQQLRRAQRHGAPSFLFSRRSAASPRTAPGAATLTTEGQNLQSGEADLDTQSLYAEFAELLDQYDHNFKRGDMVTGTIFRVDERGAYVDIGAKAPAHCPDTECSICPDAKPSDVLQVDSQREFVITRDYGEIKLSLKQLETTLAWQRIRQLSLENVTVHGKVISFNRGGLLVEVENIKGFVPTSHLGQNVNAANALGKTLPLKILDVDEEGSRLVLSNRKAENSGPEASLKVGDVVEGTVISVKHFGAVVDLGTTSGLLHVSQISSSLINNVESVLSVGDKLKVMIISKDRTGDRISLSTKKLEPNPGDMLKDPALVYAMADEMAASFRERVAAAEAAADASNDKELRGIDKQSAQ